jgi:hypothetical protein
MQNKDSKTPLTFNGISFDVATTGNADTDFQVGNSMMLCYLKSLRDNFNESNPLPPAPAQLQNIISELAKDATLADIHRGFLVSLDMILQPMAYALRNVFDEVDMDFVAADIATAKAK